MSVLEKEGISMDGFQLAQLNDWWIRTHCKWCEKYVELKDRKHQVKAPQYTYCEDCFKKGLEMEKEAMGEI